MNISTETIGRLLASGRGYAQAFIGICGTLGVLSAAQQKTLTESLSEIITGLSQVMHGFTSIWQILVIISAPVASIILAKWSSNSAKTSNQAAAVKAAVIDPNTPISPETKAAIVVAATEVTK